MWFKCSYRTKKKGIETLVIEKGNVVDSIYKYPTHQTFFSSSDKLSIGDIPFIVEESKPHRNQALVYYREVVNKTITVKCTITTNELWSA